LAAVPDRVGIFDHVRGRYGHSVCRWNREVDYIFDRDSNDGHGLLRHSFGGFFRWYRRHCRSLSGDEGGKTGPDYCPNEELDKELEAYDEVKIEQIPSH